MALVAVKSSKVLLILQVACRWLLSRNGHLLLAVALIGMVMILVNVNISDILRESSSPLVRSEILYPYFDGSAKSELSSAEKERQKRVSVFSRILRKQVKRQRWKKDDIGCIHPRLDLKHDANQFAYYKLPPLDCMGNGFFFSRKGMLMLNTSVIDSPVLIAKCSFFKIQRVNDNTFTYAETIVNEIPPFNVSVNHDFVRVRCVLKSTLEENRRADNEEKEDTGNHQAVEDVFADNDREDKHAELSLDTDKSIEKLGNKLDSGEAPNNSSNNEGGFGDYYPGWNDNHGFFDYEEVINPDAEDSDFDQFLVQVNPKPEVFHRISKIKASSHQHQLKLNVLLFALDSMSHLCFQRKLPKVYKYLKDTLGAAIMENYNIVGDATTAAIIPILTGKTEMELPEMRASKFDSGMVDEYPLIWKKFRNHGYVTMFAEDEPTISIFNLRFNGFQDQPTDHYMRPFWQALWDSSLRQSSERFCTGDIAHHRFMLHYLEDFFIKYNNVSRFAFGFHGELSHSDSNPAQYIDDDLFSFLQRLNRGSYLEDTVLVLFGDHGARFSKVRYTIQGKLEERLPMMSFVFPQTFRKQYPKLFSNLMTNTQRLSTPFDIHETLLDILHLSRVSDSSSTATRSISLLREIPANRTCMDAGISMHWCTCLHQVTLDSNEEFVKPVVQKLIRHLNAVTSQQRVHCAKLHLQQILSAQIVIPNEQVLKYLKSKDQDQREANFSQEVDPDVVHYQVQIVTQPCGAQFEATIMADFRNYSNYVYRVTPGISRINLYGSQPKCIQEEFPMLKKFCCCIDFLKEEKMKSVQNTQRKINNTVMRKSPN